MSSLDDFFSILNLEMNNEDFLLILRSSKFGVFFDYESMAIMLVCQENMRISLSGKCQKFQNPQNFYFVHIKLHSLKFLSYFKFQFVSKF